MSTVRFSGVTTQNSSYGVTNWVTPQNAYGADANYAFVEVSGSAAEITTYLQMSGSNGLPTPAPGNYNRIDGVTAYVYGYSQDGGPAGSAKSYSARILSGGAIVGTDIGFEAIDVLKDSSSNSEYSIGSISTKWGCSQSELENITGFVIAFYQSGLKTAFLQVDALYADIEYTETPLGSGDTIYQQRLAKKRSSFMQFLEDD